LERKQGQATRAVHDGVNRQKKLEYAITTPIVQSSTFAFGSTQALTDFMHNKVWGGAPSDRVEYGRYGNPTIMAVERKLAKLEDADDAVLFSSGMAGITTILLASLSSDTHIVMTDDCYRRTRQFCEVFLQRFGVETSVVPMGDYEALEAAIIPKRTRLIISESPTNPYLRVADFARIADIAKTYKIQTMIDSTFGTPINQHPLQYGIDYVTHSATKYLGGHHDLIGGVVLASKDRIAALRGARGVLGGVFSPQEAFLLERGLRTLPLRVARHNENGQQISEYLEQHPKVRKVWYPGLVSHPDHALAVQQMSGFGGVVSFELETDYEGTGRFVDALVLPYIAASFGGVESLVEQPALMSYYEMEPEARAEVGISESLVRFAVGVEDASDIIADLEQALTHI